MSVHDPNYKSSTAGCHIHRASVSRGGGGMDFEDGTFELL
jgi:hypothetical protein